MRNPVSATGVRPATMIIARLVGVEAGLERETQTEVGNQQPDVGETRSQLEQGRLSFFAVWATVWERHPASFASAAIDTA